MDSENVDLLLQEVSPTLSSSQSDGGLLGGKGKKKKKKNFASPKKTAHKHKTVKMSVLNYFSVEGEGEEAKVNRARMECPHPICLAGVYMAAHKDRRSCGKCGLSLNLN